MNTGTKLNPGEFDCYHAAAPNEPMFVLLARDPLAAALVQLWADLRAGLNDREPTTDCDSEEYRRQQEARRIAADMHGYCLSLGRRPVDVSIGALRAVLQSIRMQVVPPSLGRSRLDWLKGCDK